MTWADIVNAWVLIGTISFWVLIAIGCAKWLMSR